MDVVGVSAGPSPVRVGTGRGARVSGRVGSTVPSPAPVVSPAESVVSGFPASAAPLSAHVDSVDSLRVYETSVVTLSSPAHVTTDDAFVGGTAGECDRLWIGVGRTDVGGSAVVLERVLLRLLRLLDLPPSKYFILSLFFGFQVPFQLSGNPLLANSGFPILLF